MEEEFDEFERIMIQKIWEETEAMTEEELIADLAKHGITEEDVERGRKRLLMLLDVYQRNN